MRQIGKPNSVAATSDTATSPHGVQAPPRTELDATDRRSKPGRGPSSRDAPSARRLARAPWAAAGDPVEHQRRRGIGEAQRPLERRPLRRRPRRRRLLDHPLQPAGSVPPPPTPAAPGPGRDTGSVHAQSSITATQANGDLRGLQRHPEAPEQVNDRRHPPPVDGVSPGEDRLRIGRLGHPRSVSPPPEAGSREPMGHDGFSWLRSPVGRDRR